MVKECTVILRNALIMVVDYEGEKIQLPTDNNTSKSVFIKYSKGTYELINKSEYDKLRKVRNKAKETELVNDVATDSYDKK